MKIKIWSLKQGYKPTESSDSAHDFVGSDLIKTRFSELEVGAEGQLSSQYTRPTFYDWCLISLLS